VRDGAFLITEGQILIRLYARPQNNLNPAIILKMINITKEVNIENVEI